ncbi:MAG: adenylosuccinate synthase [Firmicutes bacterium]|nr:adenylosuccinate synthase [Bacillota bacterium]
MTIAALVGTQWGDEGKGKITDVLASRADLVVRYQGGNNAGHTVVIGDQQYKLHLVPSGILSKGKICLIGNGVVVDPQVLAREINYLRDLGVDTSNLGVSAQAHLIMPYHKALDGLEEESRSLKIGTTGRGIGPAYVDKYKRLGIRLGDLSSKEHFERALDQVLPYKNRILEKIYGQKVFKKEEIMAEYLDYAELIVPLLTDTSLVIDENRLKGKNILLEGAQGTLLDIDHGTYPYVTSSHPTAGGAAAGAGLGPTRIDEVIGIVKAYTTRVGEGPFPTELKDAAGDLIRERGREYGTTTGRPRRCGWLDAVILRYSARINGLTSFALTLLDVLDSMESVKVCTAYDYRGQRLEHFPTDLDVLKECRPIYREFPGWKKGLSSIREYQQLPGEARAYLEFLEEEMGCPVKIVSVGPRRDQTIILGSVF